MRYLFISLICLLLMLVFIWHVVSYDIELSNEIETETVSDPVRLRAFEIASSLDDNLLAAQVLISGIDGRGGLQPQMESLFTDHPTGGVMLFRYNLNTPNDSIRDFLSQVSTLINEKSGVAPFIAVDHEGGTVYRFQNGVAALPAASSYWEASLSQDRETALQKIFNDVFRSGFEIKQLGINMNFAPVAEYLTDNNRKFLESRSYGPEPSFAAEAAAVFISAMEQAGVMCVVKHFPGSAGPDPHYSFSVINGDKDELDELVFPFAYVFKNGARAVMAAHTIIPEMDDKIASLSQVVMRNWLRRELKFDGIIISDDFTMAAAGSTSPEEAAILSIAAGADMVLVWPGNLARTHAAFIAAIEEGRLSRERLIDAAARIIYEKQRLGLM